MLKIAFNEKYFIELPAGHRFPMEKYALLPIQLKHEGIAAEENFFSPQPVSRELILTVHTREYLDKLESQSLSKAEIRRTGFPLSQALVDREKNIMGGSVEAVDHALIYGVSGNAAGGTHHAFRDFGEGFCLLNDVALATEYAKRKYGFKKFLVIDLDVHQGNGTAKIFENDPHVYTFSMHGAKNFPMHKEKSDLDVALPDGMGDAAYLRQLHEHLDRLFDEAQPELVFYVSGVDVLKTDKLGRLGLTLAGCKTRDEMVFGAAYQRGIPVVFSLGGGYSPRIADIIDAHANTFRVARDIFDL